MCGCNNRATVAVPSAWSSGGTAYSMGGRGSTQFRYIVDSAGLTFERDAGGEFLTDTAAYGLVRRLRGGGVRAVPYDTEPLPNSVPYPGSTPQAAPA